MEHPSLTIVFPNNKESKSQSSNNSILDNCLSKVVETITKRIGERMVDLIDAGSSEEGDTFHHLELLPFYETLHSDLLQTYNWEELILRLEEASGSISTFSESPYTYNSKLNLAKIDCLNLVNAILQDEFDDVKNSLTGKFDKESILVKLLLVSTDNLITQLQNALDGMSGRDAKTRFLKSVKQTLHENIKDHQNDRPTLEAIFPVEQIISDIENEDFSNEYDIKLVPGRTRAGRYWFQFRWDNKFTKFERSLDVNNKLIHWIDHYFINQCEAISLQSEKQKAFIKLMFKSYSPADAITKRLAFGIDSKCIVDSTSPIIILDGPIDTDLKKIVYKTASSLVKDLKEYLEKYSADLAWMNKEQIELLKVERRSQKNNARLEAIRTAKLNIQRNIERWILGIAWDVDGFSEENIRKAHTSKTTRKSYPKLRL
jgi:hypothetical protein